MNAEPLTVATVLTDWLSKTNAELDTCLANWGVGEIYSAQRSGDLWQNLRATVHEHQLAPGRFHVSIREANMHDDLRGAGTFGRYLEALEADPRVAEISVANIRNPRLRTFLAQKRGFRDGVTHAFKRPRPLLEFDARWSKYRVVLHTDDAQILDRDSGQDPRWIRFRAMLHEAFPGCPVSAADTTEHRGVRVSRDAALFERWLPSFLVRTFDLESMCDRVEKIAQSCAL
ncbi:MAG: hypothetical protein JSR82_05705 [Verrucomicrobia bacterium]|nr:hypothetical protein [Verrucomicrobiota bacterium]